MSLPRPIHATAVLAVGATLLLSACGTDAASSDDESPDAGAPSGEETPGETGSDDTTPIEISVGALPIVPTVAIQYGLDNGLFEEHGIDLTLETGVGSETMVAAVLADEIDFATLNTVSVMVAADAGVPIQVAAGFSHALGPDEESDISAVLAPADSGIVDAADLAGRSVAVNTLASAGTISIREAVRAAGGDPDEIEFVEIRYPEMIAALENDQVDAIWEVEPFITFAQGAGHEVVSWNFRESSPGVTTQVMVTAQDQDPVVIDRFHTALTAVLDAAEADPDGVRASLTTLLDMDAELAGRVRLESFSTDIDVDAVGVFADLALADGLVSQEVDLSLFEVAAR